MGIGAGIFCFAIWLLLSGYFDNVLLLTFGVLSCVLVVVIAQRMKLLDEDTPSLLFGLRSLVYFPWLLVEIVKSNIDVAKRILDPQLPISPTIFRVKTSQRGDLAKVLYANSITLTPGTVSIRVNNDEIEVHALTREAAQGFDNGEMDRRVSWVEGRH
jgi:multicomponent Na+:H+ antiporter subunit E